MAIYAIDPEEHWVFVCKDDTEEPTRWRLRCLRARERAELDGLIKFEPGTRTPSNLAEVDVRTVEMCLVGWEGLLDANGISITFDEENQVRNVNRIPGERFRELAEEIYSRSRVGPEAGK